MAALHPILQSLLKLGDPMGRPQSKANNSKGASFFAEGRFAARDLGVRVNGHGLLDQPLTAAQAQQLHDLSRPSQFGHRERTLLDRKVRHSGEIDADDLELAPDGPAWTRLLKQVSQELGSGPLEAWVHKLLIYGPGQFFKPHQDTEKREGMVGTLVLIWPCAHIGGALRVQHADQTTTFASQQLQSDDIRWCAFYADCRHEVLPVEEGWRVALTYDLVVPKVVRSPRAQAPDPEVLAALGAHFQSGERDTSRPWVLMLDHEYTEHGLRWHLIKGHDRERVGALRDAADALGLTVHLALMQVQESWTAVTEYRGRHQRGGAVTPDELIERSFSLDFWVDRDGRVGPHASLSIQASDTESFTETGPEHLVNEEYEGYMGNWGETLDYWYRRAALVIQSPAAAERSSFAIDFDGALRALGELARGSESDRQLAALRVERVGDLLRRQAAQRGRSLLASYGQIAASLPDETSAHKLMAPFKPARFTPTDAKTLARLQSSRGESWVRELIRQWAPDAGSSTDNWRSSWGSEDGPVDPGYGQLWPSPLRAFVAACTSAGLSSGVVDEFCESLWFPVLRQLDIQQRRATPVARSAALPERIHAASQLAEVVADGRGGRGAIAAQLVDHVCASPSLYPETDWAPLVQAFGSANLMASPLRERAISSLSIVLGQPERLADDHSLQNVEWVCHCVDCTSMQQWAHSAEAQPLLIAMAEPRRAHLTSKIREAGAPLVLETIRQGSPHKLRLSKPTDLRAREQAERARWQRDLELLRALA
jgi:hypothetical protein